MPPKPVPGKKGKDDQEDYSDVPTLPPLNSLTFALLYQNFPQTEIREKLQKFVTERIPQDRVKILTRDEIVTYGKQKQIILEPNVAAALPQDDPRLKMTEDDQLAKATVDRLFELSVHARRAKKEKILKLEEEAKAQPDAVIPQPDPDLLDLMFQLVDFPQTKSEAIALSKYGNTLNTVFAIDFVNLPPQDDDMTVDESIRDQFPMEISEQEQAHTLKVIQKIGILRDARSASIKGSQIRNMAIVDLEYLHYPKNVTRINEQGEEVEEKKEPESIFLVELQTQLERYGALYVKYLRFRDKVKVIPLMPDKRTMQEMSELDQDQKEYSAWLNYVDQQMQQDTLSQTQKDQLDPASLEDYNRQKEQKKLEVDQEKKTKQEQQDERRRRLNQLQGKLKNSIDDQKDYSQFKMTHYEKDFIQNKEAQNTIASVMSAMLTQLGDKSDYTQATIDQDQENDESDNLDDIFSSFETEVRYDIKLDERPSASQLRSGTQAQQQFLAPNVNRPKRQGTEALSRQKTAIGDVEYQEELDKAKRTMLKLPKEVTSLEEEKAQDIYLREKNAYMNLVIPGVDRHLMPRVPSKSQRIRNAENPGIYPFSTLPVDDAERAMIMKSFQELIIGNQIDEGQTLEAKHAKYKVFERCYESHMQPEIMRQTIADALLQDPDVATMYYQRNDSLLVALYNKIIADENEEKIIDGQKEWRAAYRVLPDFENWLKYFSDSMIIPVQNNNAASSANIIQPQKYQLDDEMVPDQMLDIDDQKISNIQESSQMLYPDDNSIMRVDNFEIGGQKFSKSIVVNDNLTFGLRTAKVEDEKEEDKEFGLASYKKIGDTELWIHFENDAKMLVETIQIKANDQKMIRIDPPKPTPEEIAAREEAVKQAQLLAAKNKGKNSQLGNLPPVEEYKEPEPTWEPEQPNYLDSYFDECKDMCGPQITTTYPNGLIVKHLFNGDICQTLSDNILTNTTQEYNRIITGRGVVIRQLRNKDVEVLYPNGYKSFFDRENMTWTVINNKGMRRALKDGVQWDLDQIPCATETDSVTNAKMMIREDNVMTIQFQDGSYYCQHSDGTQMRTNGDESEIRIEKEGLAPIVIKAYQRQEWPSEEENKKRMTAAQRATDGIVKETLMPDGTVVETFRDILDYQSGYEGNRHVFRRPDFSVLLADENGQMVIISSNTRSVLNENGGKAAMGKDNDYAKEFSRSSDSYTRCVYYATISPEEGQSNILTVDERYKYILTSYLGLVKISNDDQYEGSQHKSMIEKSEKSQIYDDGREIEEIGGWKNPFTKHYLFPRLFVIKPNGSGWELLSKEQLEYYFRIQKSKDESLKQRKVVMVGSTSAKSHYFVTKVKALSDKEQELQFLKTQEYPQNARYALLRTQAKKARSERPTHPLPEQYLFRQIFEFQEFDGFKQDAFYDDIQRYRQWRLGQVRYDSEFGITHVPGKDQQLDVKKIEDEEYYAKRINIKILKERRNQRAQFKPEEYKQTFLNDIAGNEEMTEYHRRVTQKYDRDDSWRASGGNPKSENAYDRQNSHTITNENITQENFRAKKLRAAGGEAKVKHKLAEIQKMLNTPTFIPQFFKSNYGHHFTKNNPEKPPSQEVLMRMSQRINRSQNNTEKGNSQYDGYSQKSDQNSPNQKAGPGADDQMQDGDEDKDNPIVALEPEDQFKQGSAFLGSKQGGNTMGQQPLPSLYVQEKIYLNQREQEQLLKSEEYHVVKTKDFNVYGRLRQDKPFVKSIVKGEPITELNEKFITTELIADRRVKISSMAPRQYMNAPSVEDVRKQGQHQMILSAINKKQTFAELINQANSMVTGILHDPLKRCLNVLPSKCQFGTILAGKPYEMTITLKNEDSLAQRVTIKPTQDKRIVVEQDKFGPIAPGMIRKIYVSIRSNPDDESNVKEDLQILTKSDIFKIPVQATILGESKFREIEEESMKLGKKIQNSRVRDRLNSSIKDGQYLQSENMDAIDQMISAAEAEPKRGQWIETTGSESKLPKLPSIDKRQFDVDPKKTLKDVLKK